MSVRQIGTLSDFIEMKEMKNLKIIIIVKPYFNAGIPTITSSPSIRHANSYTG